jgi:hypothetical protein
MRRTSAAHSSPYDSARRFTKMSGRTSYSWVPTVSSTRVATIEPTWAERSSDSPQERAAKNPARKPSPTPVGS